MLWKLKHTLNDFFEGEIKGPYLGGSIEPTLLDAKLAMIEREDEIIREEIEDLKSKLNKIDL